MRWDLVLPVLCCLSFGASCAVDVAEESDALTARGRAAQELTFASSDDSQSSASSRVVSMVDRFIFSVDSAKVTDVSWVEDDMKVTVCVRDDIAGRDIQCISGRNSDARVGESISIPGNFVFDKGRNSAAYPGDFSPGNRFSVRMRIQTFDGVDRSTYGYLQYTWDDSKRNYYLSDVSGASCGVTLVGFEIAPLTEYATMEACIGSQSGAKVTWRMQWVKTDIYGRVASNTGQVVDGPEWHHFGFVPLTWFLPNEQIGAQLSPSSGDADLYTRMLLNPNLNDYDCRPYRSGTTVEQCEELGFLRAYSVRNYKTNQTSVYHLELFRGGFLVPIF